MIKFSIISSIGHAIEGVSKVVGWNPLGKRIRIVANEGIDKTLLGTSATGVILTEPGNVITSGSSGSTLSECTVIQLDAPLHLMQRDIEMLAVVPRHAGFGFYRLPLTSSIAVSVIPVSEPAIPREVQYQEVIGVWEMSLLKNKGLRGIVCGLKGSASQ